MPELPPAWALNAGKTVDETAADLKQHPLFMTELDADGAEDNPDLAALQALAYDGTPLENAANFKEQGNESFRAKRWADAKEFYAKGVAILTAEERRRRNSTEDGDGDGKEAQQERALLEQLHVNRAACHLELANYRSCTADCAAALRLNPANVKALYRSGRALLAVDRVAEADDACARGLALDSANPALLSLARSVADRAAHLEVARKAAEARDDAVRQREARLRAALRANGIRTRSTGKPPQMEDARVQMVQDADGTDGDGSLVFPTVLLYPEHLESDFIKAFGEAESLDQHFGYVFPLPWDREGVYAADTVECYMETTTGGLVKVGRKVPLLKVLGSGSVEVVDDLLKIFVVPKAKAAAWVKEFKEKRAAQKGG